MLNGTPAVAYFGRLYLIANGNNLKISLKGIDKSVISYYHAQMTMQNKTGNPRYAKGQRVIIKPVSEKGDRKSVV